MERVQMTIPHVFLTLAVLSCLSSAVLKEKETRLAKATNEFAVNILKSCSKEKNVFVSPFSISTALSLLYIGAEGSTRQKLSEVLKYDKHGLSQADVQEAFMSLGSKVQHHADDYQLFSYNSLLIQKGFHFLSSYKHAARKYYSTRTHCTDFTRHGKKIQAKINDEVSRTTKGNIKKFLEEPPSPDTKLFLLNVVYFLGNWKKTFNPLFTRQDSFYNNGVYQKPVEMMYRDGDYGLAYMKELKSSIVILPYRGENSASMLIVLPDQKNGVEELEKKLTREAMNEALQNTFLERIELRIPKFHLEYSTNLTDTLVNLGLGELFSDEANLNGIASEQEPLKVSSVMHKAVIDVNEKGSEAAAATGFELVFRSMPPVLTVDHPFIFFIREDRNGMILFAGRVDEL